MVKKVELFSQTFRGREDVVPRYWESNRTGKKGYSPLCRNEWKEGICHKPCLTCENADYIPLSDEVIIYTQSKKIETFKYYLIHIMVIWHQKV